jgi:hypothetical protein
MDPPPYRNPNVPTAAQTEPKNEQETFFPSFFLPRRAGIADPAQPHGNPAVPAQGRGSRQFPLRIGSDCDANVTMSIPAGRAGRHG